MSDELETPPVPADRPAKSAYESLSSRHRRFVDLIVSGEKQFLAAIAVGCKAQLPGVWACRLRAKPNIQAAIAEREALAMENAGITRTRTWLEVRRIAYLDKRKLYDDKGNLVPVHLLDDDTAAALSSMEVDDTHTGRVRKIRLCSKNDALKMILQAQGELIEKHELTDLTPPSPPIIQIVRYPDSKVEGDGRTDSPRAD